MLGPAGTCLSTSAMMCVCCRCQVVQGEAETVCHAHGIREQRTQFFTQAGACTSLSLKTERGGRQRARNQPRKKAPSSPNSLTKASHIVHCGKKSSSFAGSWFKNRPNRPDAPPGPPNTSEKRCCSRISCGCSIAICPQLVTFAKSTCSCARLLPGLECGLDGSEIRG